MNPTRSRVPVLYLVLIAIIAMVIVFQFQSQSASQTVVPINEVADMIRAGQVAKIEEDDDRLSIVTNEAGDPLISYKETSSTLVEQLAALGLGEEELSSHNVLISIKPPSPWLGFATIFGYIFPFLILGGVFWFVFG